jgi:type IV pilus assembly protein PilA
VKAETHGGEQEAWYSGYHWTAEISRKLILNRIWYGIHQLRSKNWMVLAASCALKNWTKSSVWVPLVFAGLLFVSMPCHAYQAAKKGPATGKTAPDATHTLTTNPDWTAEFKKNPELWKELGKLISRMQQEVQLPGMRRQSHILARLTDSTNIYAAFPNYGEALHQAHVIFKQQLNDSPKLREWWQKSDLNKSDPKVDDTLDLVYQFSQYLGDEIVISGSYKDKNGLLMAEIKKPGLEKFLPEMYKTLSGKSNGTLQVFNPQQLAEAKANGANNVVALVRPDFLLIGSDLDVLRTLNAQLDAGKKGFQSTPFGQRMNQAYVDGTGMLIGVDLQPMVPDFTKKERERALLNESGFGDMKYGLWEAKDHNSGAELSFTSPRHGIASWLANSAPLGGLDFLSPGAPLAGSVLLKNPAQMFDDYRDLATIMDPDSLQMLAQMQMELGIDFRSDLLSKLDGEIAYELDTPFPIDKGSPSKAPTWRLALHVNDAIGLQQTFSKLLMAAHMETRHMAEGKFTVNSFQVPSGPEPLQINYSFADGYLLVGSSRAALSESLRVHQSGESLAKSAKFRAALPDNQAQVATALHYQNMGSAMAMFMKQLPPDFIQTLPPTSMEVAASVSAIYGSDRAIRATSNSNGASLGVALAVAAIAIPNLLRSRMAANESAAVSIMRTINTAQVTYAVQYPNIGYARDLASLGPGTSERCDTPSPKHACLLDAVLGDAACTTGKWCRKSGYNFSVSASCRFGTCPGYVAVATPVNAESGTKNFCSVEDAIVRTKIGTQLISPITAAECRRWTPLR